MTHRSRIRRGRVRRTETGGASGPGLPDGWRISASRSRLTRSRSSLMSAGRLTCRLYFFSVSPMPEMDCRMSVSAMTFFIW